MRVCICMLIYNYLKTKTNLDVFSKHQILKGLWWCIANESIAYHITITTMIIFNGIQTCTGTYSPLSTKKSREHLPALFLHQQEQVHDYKDTLVAECETLQVSARLIS